MKEVKDRKFRARYYKGEKGLMKDVNAFWRETGGMPCKGGNSLLIGNKDIIKRDILGIDLDK